MRKALLLLALSLFGTLADAQQTQVTAQQFNVETTNRAPNVTNATAVSDFEAGATTRYYWIITRLAGVASTPVQTSDTKGPVTLSNSSGGRITISWRTPDPAATFDVLETATATLPLVVNCSCAVQTGITGTSVIDVGTYTSYNTAFPQGFSWNIQQTYGSNLPSLNFVYNGTTVCSITPGGGSTCGSTGSGTVSSVGLSLPSPVMSVSGSPVTTAGTLVGTFNPEAPNTVFAGPTAGSIGGVPDGAQSVNEGSNTTTLPFSLTPTTATDFAILVTSSNFNIGTGAVNVVGAGTWNVVSGGSGTALYTQQLASSATIAPVVTSANPTTWSGGLALIKTTGTVTVVQTQSTSGAVNNGAHVTISPTAGNSLLACVFGAINASPAPSISDSRGNLYPLLVAANIPDNTFSLNGTSATCWLSNTVPVGGSTIVTYNNNTHGVSGSFTVTELNGVAIDNGTPTFRPLAVADMPLAVQTLVNTPTPGVTSFTNVLQASDITVTTSATSVMSATITMPASGCPCRPFMNYSLYPSYSGVTNVAAQVIWVDDGTIQGLLMQTGESNASTGARTSITNGGFFPRTYANGASITFTLFAQQDAGSTFLLNQSPLFGPSVTASFQVSIFSSN